MAGTGRVPPPPAHRMAERVLEVDGLPTRVLEGGSGPDVVLLHSGEFGATAELTWEYTFAALTGSHRVLAPEWLGYGGSAKVFDFADPIGFRLRHMRRTLEALGVADAVLVGSSMSGALLLRDAAAEAPVLPARAIVSISGGGPVLDNDARAALLGWDGSAEAMARLVDALVVDPCWARDPDHLARRLAAARLPGAWECSAAARLRAPFRERGTAFSAVDTLPYERVAPPALVITGALDRLKPPRYGRAMAERMPCGAWLEVPGCGHLCQVERPDEVNAALLAFLREQV